ncbi:hypothetical protein ACFQY4_40590 [Catellatospora bangladeshensis]|uniref:SMI1/KNR4 family protein n=1 Tax=Catellatospora bangladeshensis TaxID=310355 RepID=A0A8J3JRE4_9ACTN|nr:hypothetical protein [Catellatospora bangladeshensis]GIF83745.1 hypothetical protein Cba03nite_50940 [Catellatospora bangladeshensis]
MVLTAATARDLLGALPVAVVDPLDAREFADLERRFGFTFNPDHRTLLATGLPTGPRWPDWRTDPGDLRDRLAAPIDGVLFDVQENGYWHPSWGERPSRTAFALAVARRHLDAAPRLVPVYSHRYAPALPEPGLPVLSVMQTDVIVYGTDLAAYLRREFGLPGPGAAPTATPIPFWSDLT